MDDYAKIMNTVSRFMMNVDECNWTNVQDLMADSFHADFSSLTGKPAMDATPQEFTRLWASILSRYKASHHQMGNPIVAIHGETAQYRCHVTATHLTEGEEGAEVETLVGSYRIPLVLAGSDWKLAGVTFSLTFTTSTPA